MIYFQKYVLFIFLVLLDLNSLAQRDLILKRSLTIKCPNPEYFINRCSYNLLVPFSRPGKQEISEYKYSVAPFNVFKTENNDYFLNWKNKSFFELNTVKLEVTMKVKIKIYDLKTAKKHPVKNNKDLDTLSCLKDEENFRSNSKSIKAVAENLKGNDREEIVKNIFNYVDSVLDYHIFYFQDRGAKQALKDGKGDCTEYSELMITLCRAKKIPARIVKGLIPNSNGTIGHHNWVEVYFPQYDWVAFDPTWADSPKATTSFYSMKNAYIQTSNQRYISDVKTSCQSEEFPFSIKLNDTCMDLTNSISQKVKSAQEYYQSNQLVKAAGLIDTLILLEPDNYVFWLYRGVIYAREGQFEKGLECLKTSLKNTETNLEKNRCLYGFANFYGLKSDGENAVKYLREAIDLGFDNYNHLYIDSDFFKIKDYQPFIDLQNALKLKQEKEKKK
ncbi:MAG: hypothetical protein H0U95_10940 [Bacteroidetes bacterium]|nr:hypothetical protein [Bacteroidota bacterium]